MFFGNTITFGLSIISMGGLIYTLIFDGHQGHFLQVVKPKQLKLSNNNIFIKSK